MSRVVWTPEAGWDPEAYDRLVPDIRGLAERLGRGVNGADVDREARHLRLDRWMEAVYGARLRFHARSDDDTAAYWQRVYKRWAQLYHWPRVVS